MGASAGGRWSDAAEKGAGATLDHRPDVLLSGRHHGVRARQEPAQCERVELQQGEAVRRVELQDRATAAAGPYLYVPASGGGAQPFVQQGARKGPGDGFAVERGLGREVDEHRERIVGGVPERGGHGDLTVPRGDQSGLGGLFEDDVHAFTTSQGPLAVRDTWTYRM